MHAYRTTFTADPQVAKAIKELARKQGKSISAVVNSLLKCALDGTPVPPTPAEEFVIKPFTLNLRPGIDPERITQAFWDLEDSDYPRH